MGVWTHDLKVADWHEVQKLALNALCEKCKDLQLGVWLFESSIHLREFAGIAPAAVFVRELCDTYWDTMHPLMVDGDLEYRTNPINWINEKITPQLHLIKLTNTVLDGEEYCWDDWANGLRYEQLKNQQKDSGEWEGPTPKVFKQRLAATASELLVCRYQEISDGISALDDLQRWFDQRCGDASPSLADMLKLLTDISYMIGGELQRRGVRLAAAEAGDATGKGDDSKAPPAGGGSGDGGGGKLRDRADAFVMLRRAAEFLMADDPHSPVPYLVYTACEWGEKSAPDLYQELFLKQGGQLNIFELMGLNVEQGE